MGVKNERRSRPSLLGYGLLLSFVICHFSFRISASPVSLHVEAGRGMEAIAEGIRKSDMSRFDVILRMVGLEDAGEPILVLVAPESSQLAQRTPTWISGYAQSDEGFVVLFPARATTYPIDGLEELLRHEIAHVLIHRAAGGRAIPRWFNEGVATVAGDTWGMPDRSRFTLAMIRGDDPSLRHVEAMFHEGQPAVARAYAIAGAFTVDLLQREGSDAAARILAEVRAGQEFPAAFQRATGKSLYSVEREFWRRTTIWNRWIPIVTSSVALWGAISLLAMWAIRVRRRRDQLRLEAMDLADELAELRRADDEIVN
jgi:hypothetical protein